MIKRVKRRLRRQLLAARGYTEELDCQKSPVGLADGTWTLSTSLLGPDSVIYSVGVGTDISFDLALIKQTGATVHAFDPTPRSIEWIGEQSLPEKFKFYDYGLASFDGNLSFFVPRKQASAHYTPVKLEQGQSDSRRFEAPVFSLKTIMKNLGHQRLDLLKLDIEGGEYDVLRDILASQIEVDQLLIEFHHNYRSISFSKTKEALDSLREYGYRILHISDRTYEFSLLKQHCVTPLIQSQRAVL